MKEFAEDIKKIARAIRRKRRRVWVTTVRDVPHGARTIRLAESRIQVKNPGGVLGMAESGCP